MKWLLEQSCRHLLHQPDRLYWFITVIGRRSILKPTYKNDASQNIIPRRQFLSSEMLTEFSSAARKQLAWGMPYA